MRRWGTWIAVVVLVACAAAVAVVFAGSRSSGTAAAAGPDRTVREWPHWTGDVTCGGVPFDPRVAFSRPPDAAEGDRPAEVAFREFLEAGGMMRADPKPLHGWRLLGERGKYAEFANGSPRGGKMKTWTVGPWHGGLKPLSFDGNCQPSLLRHGQAAISWTLARGQHLGPSTRSLRVDLGPGGCSGGASQDRRLERPRFRVEGGALLMALWIRPVRAKPNEMLTCVGRAEPPATIRLPRPLGHLKLLDGGVFPPMTSAEEIRRGYEI